jgi:hypothetical protein
VTICGRVAPEVVPCSVVRSGLIHGGAPNSCVLPVLLLAVAPFSSLGAKWLATKWRRGDGTSARASRIGGSYSGARPWSPTFDGWRLRRIEGVHLIQRPCVVAWVRRQGDKAMPWA